MRVTDIEKEYGKTLPEILQDLVEKGKTAVEIARVFDCCPSTVRYHAKKLGIRLPPGAKWEPKSIHAYK